MPERAEQSKPTVSLDNEVDVLLADAEANEQATADAAAGAKPVDAAEAAEDDGLEFASPDDLLNEVNASLETLATDVTELAEESAVEPPVAQVEEPGAIDEPVDVDEPIEAEVAAAAIVEKPAAPQPKVIDPAPMTEAEMSSPETIARLDERLAANARALSESHVPARSAPVSTARTKEQAASLAATAVESVADLDAQAAAADVVDDAEIQAQMVAEEKGSAPQVSQPATRRETLAEARPAAVQPAPVARVHAPVAVAAEPARPARQFHLSSILAGAVAIVLRPLASFTARLSPGVRQTVGYAALVTVFQAACLWGFLVFRGPPKDPAPVSDPTVLRVVGDDEKHAEAMRKAAAAKPAPAPKPKPAPDAAHKAEAKPKSGAKKDDHASGGH